MRLEHRVNEAIGMAEGTKTEAERLYDAYQEGKRLEREGKSLCESVRPEIEALMSDGEKVGYGDAWMAYQESEKFTVDLDALVEDLGEKIALRVCDVSSAKVRKLVELGLIPADAPYLKKTVAKSLVTMTRPKEH